MATTHALIVLLRHVALPACAAVMLVGCSAKAPECGNPEVATVVSGLARSKVLPGLPLEQAARIEKAIEFTLKDPTRGTLSADGNSRECGATLVVKYAEAVAEVPIDYSLMLLEDTSRFQASLEGSDQLEALQKQLMVGVVISLMQQPRQQAAPPPAPSSPAGSLASINGIWAKTREECLDEEGPNSRTFFEFTPDNRGTIDGYEEHCKVVSTRARSGGADVDLTCEFAGDETSRTTAIVIRSAEAITLDGNAYVRCR